MAAASNSDMFNKMLWHPSGGGAGGIAAQGQGTGSGGTMKQRKTNFTSREVESLLKAVADRKDTVLFGVAGGIGWARAWHEVAQRVSAVEGIHRSESDVRKKWTYLKWEAKNTSKPGRDPTSRAVLDILTSRDRGEQPNSLLEQLLVPQGASGSPVSAQNANTPVPIAPKKVSQGNNVPGNQQPAPVQPQPQPQPPEVCLKWNSYHTNMRATFPSLLNNEQFVDVTLACEGRSIKCHKVMLSACSSYFEELLSQNPCQHPIVFMRDLKFWEIQALVEFMYCGEVNVTQDRLPSLLAAADALQIKGLAGPSSGTYEEDVTETDDSVGSVQKFTQQQKRIRKRKSSNPTAYPVRAQSVNQPAKKQQIQQPVKSLQPKKIQTPIAQSTPVIIKKEQEENRIEPLSLVKEEPLNLESTENKRAIDQDMNYSQEQNHSNIGQNKPLNGLSDTDDTDDESGDASGRDQTEDEELENTQKDVSHGNGYESRGDLSRGSSVDTS